MDDPLFFPINDGFFEMDDEVPMGTDIMDLFNSAMPGIDPFFMRSWTNWWTSWVINFFGLLRPPSEPDMAETVVHEMDNASATLRREGIVCGSR